MNNEQQRPPQGPAPGQAQGAPPTAPVAGSLGTTVPLPPSTQQQLPSTSNSDSGNATALASITVSSRIPEFWTDMPRLWFIQFEAALENQRLGDAARQNLVVTKLSKHGIKQVSDLLLSPPADNRYETLKDRLLKNYEEDTRQTQKLLREMELGTQKPSQLLRNMRDLARGKILDQTLIIMWNGHLPPAVQAVLAASEVTDMEKLACIADKVMEASRPMEVTEIASTSRQRPRDDDLTVRLNRLSVEVAELRKSRRPQRSVTPGRQPSRSRERNASKSGRKPGWLCFYHLRYGKKAAKCVKPCCWEDRPEKEN